MIWWAGKIIDFVFGEVIEYIVLIHEAYGLSEEEKQIVKNYTGRTFELEGNPDADKLIRKLIAVKSTHNRVIFTVKGEKIQKILEFYRL